MKGFIKIIFMFVCLASWQGIRADNMVTITGGSGSPGAEIDISISLSNTDDVSALQLAIPLVDGIDLVENSAQLGSRALATHSATVGVKDGNINVFVFSSSMATLTGNAGEVVKFKVRLGKEPTILPLSSSKIILTDADGNTVDASVQDGSVSIRTAKAEYSTREIDFGRQPILGTYIQELEIYNTGNEPLEVTAFNFSVPEFSCSEVIPFIISVGESKNVAIGYSPTERGNVSEEMKVVCNSSSKLNTITLKAIPYAVNELHIENASGTADSEVTVHLRVNNMDALSGFHFEIPIPEQLEYVTGSFALTDRKVDHQVTASVTNGTLKALCYSLNDRTFNGNDGDIATFKVKIVGRYDTYLSPSKAILTANIKGADINVLSDVYDGYISVLSPEIYANSELNMGVEPITQVPTYSYNILNTGSADLVINKIKFDSDAFDIQGVTFPINLSPWESKKISITYKNATIGSHKSTMQIYCNDPVSRLVNVNVSGTLYSPNFLTLADAGATVNTPAKIEVELSNYENVSGIQFDITYPTDKFTLSSSDIDFVVGGFSANVQHISKTTARVFVYSLSDKSFESGDAKVMTINLQPKEGLTEGTYNISIDNIKLSNNDLQNVASSTSCSLTINVAKAFLLGDADDNGIVDKDDITAVVEYIQGETPAIFNVQAADVNQNGIINVADIAEIIKILNNN